MTAASARLDLSRRMRFITISSPTITTGRLMRRLLITLHKYAGLSVGLLLALTGITGSLLVFDHALDEALAPQTLPSPDEGPPAPLQEVLAAARAAAPDQPVPIRINIARQPGSPHVVQFPAPEGAPGPLEVSVDPADARVLAVRVWGEYPMSWLYRLHYTLLAGDTGKYVVGVGGLFLLFFCLSGFYLWWPRGGQWRRALTIERGSGTFRFNYDLHKTVGFYLLPVLIVTAFSGVSIVFHDPVESLVGAVLPLQERPSPRSVPTPGAAAITVDEAVARGRAVFPDAELKRVFLPRGLDGAYQLALNQPGEPWSAHAVSAVWVDQYSGEVLAAWDALALSAGSTFLAWQFPLHNGDALGLAGRWLILIVGWAPALLFGTGMYMWWRKRGLRSETQRSSKATGSTSSS
jgi:uncharacterized iron-regulated membrane protein